MYPEPIWMYPEKTGKRYKTISFVLCFEKNLQKRNLEEEAAACLCGSLFACV